MSADTAPTVRELSDDDLIALIALLSLPHMSPNRIGALTSVVAPSAAVQALGDRALPEMAADAEVRITTEVRTSWFGHIEPAMLAVDLEAHRTGGNHLLTPSDPRWPFSNDPHPPPLAFVRGDLELLDVSPAVAVVGTRRCTSIGREVAGALGAELGRAGVAVVSGVALGIDAAAHRGSVAVGGPAIGVVACGLDVVYPASNRDLWERLGNGGLLLSEVPLGLRPTRWRFPARNRLIAALSDLVVVVESHTKGGALSTVDEAATRGVAVGVVPGSTLSPASDGTNALLYDGAMPIRHADDVLLALGLATNERAVKGETHHRSADDVQLAMPLDDLSEAERRVVEAAAGGTIHLDRLIDLLGAPPPVVGRVVETLVTRGLLEMRGHTVVLASGTRSTRG